MAFDPSPAALLGSGYGLASHKVTLETNDAANTHKTLAGLTDAEADPTTGDSRKVAFEIMEALYQAWLAVPTADRPTKMSVARSSSVNEETGVISRYYTFRFDVEPTGVEVSDE